MIEVRKGDIAICNWNGAMVLITEPGGHISHGIHLTDHVAPVGTAWQGVHFSVFGHIESRADAENYQHTIEVSTADAAQAGVDFVTRW
jgi:hypothetical protein